MEPDTELIEKGIRTPRLGLIDQANVHLELYARFATIFAQYGFTDATADELRDAVALVRSERAASIEARTISKSSRDREQAAVTNTKAFKRKLVHAFDDLHADRKVSAHVYNAVFRSGKLRRSPVLLSGYLTDVRPHVKEANDLLKLYFQGENALTLLDELVVELDAAQAAQEVDYKSLPLETRKVYEAKGRVLMYIEKMNRIAKIAFDGDAATAALFNKDLLLRARQSRRAQSTLEPVGDAATDDKNCGEGEGQTG